MQARFNGRNREDTPLDEEDVEWSELTYSEESDPDLHRYDGDVGNGCEWDEREVVDNKKVCGPKMNKMPDVTKVGERIYLGQNLLVWKHLKML